MHWMLGVGFSFLLSALGWTGCSLAVTRPVQEMSDMAAALRAAKEVEADSLAPDLYRQAQEHALKAQNEYKIQNFKVALDYIEKARKYAEQAEYAALRSGANRTSLIPPELPPPPAEEPYPYPTPTGTPYDPAGGATQPPTGR
jgi:hypothetical protein